MGLGESYGEPPVLGKSLAGFVELRESGQAGEMPGHAKECAVKCVLNFNTR